MWPAPAGRLPLGAFTPWRRSKRTGNSNVPGHRGRALIDDSRSPRLPAEPAEHHPAVFRTPHPPRSAGYPIAVRIVGISPGKDVGYGNRLDEPQPDHRRRDPGARHDLRIERAVPGIDYRVTRLLQGDLRAVIKHHLPLVAGDPDLPFRRQPRNRDILKLRAVGRLGNHRRAPRSEQRELFLHAGWDRKPNQHRYRAVISIDRGMATSVLQVTTLARASVVQRPESVGASGRARGGYPRPAKEAVPDRELCTRFEQHVGGRL